MSFWPKRGNSSVRVACPLWVMCGRRLAARTFSSRCGIGRVRSYVRPVRAAVMPGHGGLRGSGPNQNHGLYSALTQVGSRSERPCLQCPQNLSSLHWQWLHFLELLFASTQSLRCHKMAVHIIKSGHGGLHKARPLYPRKLTSIRVNGMSTLGQKRTSAAR